MVNGFSWIEVLKLSLLILASSVTGIWFLISGFRGRRVGDTPHCPSCGYNLLGLASSRCSECGKEIMPDNVVLGVRSRRGWRIAAGVVLLLLTTWIATISVVGFVLNTRVDLYQYKPTYFVLRDAESLNDQIAMRACDELDSRIQNAQLSESQMRRIAVKALAAYAQTSPRQLIDPRIGGLLYELYQRNILT